MAALAAGGVTGDPAAVDITGRWLAGYLAGAADIAAIAAAADRLAQSLLASRPADATSAVPA
jgi:hypothetical protein